jgi:flagellin-specific chaperone FliS
MLLALYDGAIERIGQARASIGRGDLGAATPLLVRSQRIVAELLAGLDFRYGELPRHLQRLYEFVLHSISLGKTTHLDAALRVLRTLREGLAGIRDEGALLERSGEIPPFQESHILRATG